MLPWSAAQSLPALNHSLDSLYSQIVVEGKIDYSRAEAHKKAISSIVRRLSTLDLDAASPAARKATLINAYNLFTINQILTYLPTASVKRIKGFFQNPHTLAGQTRSLDNIEAELQRLGNPDIHLLLICGANSCPPFPSRAIPLQKPEQSQYIASHMQTALSSPAILQVDDAGQTLNISNIFRWYADDFGDVKAWISQQIGQDYSGYKIDYLPYDWSLNRIYTDLSQAPKSSDVKSDLTRYFATRLYERGQYEVSLFNNYYAAQRPAATTRYNENYLTPTLSALFGINGRINAGLDIKMRSVTFGPQDQIATLESLKFSNQGRLTDNSGYARAGITAIGPKVKYQPFKRNADLTFQHALHIPLGNGQDGIGFIDWEAPSLYNDVFYDKPIGAKASLFVQLGIHLENMNQGFLGSGDGYYKMSAPLNVIYNYFASKKSTLYGLVNIAPSMGSSRAGEQTNRANESYYQLGGGYKYFVTDRLQAEVLYTKFWQPSIEDFSAQTFNLGLRYYGW